MTREFTETRLVFHSAFHSSKVNMSDSVDAATAIVDAFTPHQQVVLRALSVTASCLSIVFGLAGLYLYISMKHKVFRHHLVVLLLLFDFGKAVVLLWYPARVLTVSTAYDNINFCDIVGFFTSVFIEGADLAVLALAVHTALLVFGKYNGPEGGLYKWRYWVYSFNICFPLAAASLVFIDHGRHAYQPYITWCYLPVRPVWYRLWLSWIPRWIIIVSIIAIYVSIYVYIKLQYREVMKNFKQLQSYAPTMHHKNIFKRIGHWIVNFLAAFPGFAFLAEGRDSAESIVNAADARAGAIAELQRDSIMKFQIRRNIIERQVRSIFVYPIAYVFLWIAPFGLQCVQFNYEFEHGTVYWLDAAASFMQPFNCVVDTIAFCIRERPWKVHEEKIFTKENGLWVKRQLTLTRRDPAAGESHRHGVDPEKHNAHVRSHERTDDHSQDNGSTSTKVVFSSLTESSSPKQKFSNGDGDHYPYIRSPLSGGPLDPFSTTASRVEFDVEQSHTGDSESEIDIIEFLK